MSIVREAVMVLPADPRRPRPGADDEAPGLPALDGAETDATLDPALELDVRDDEASALDDRVATELEGAFDDDLDAGPVHVVGEDEAPPPVEADPELAQGEGQRWTEGSDASEDVPWQERTPADEPAESSIDRGEEGFDETTSGGDALPGLPPAHAGEEGDDADEGLDLSDAARLETSRIEVEAAPVLPRAQVSARFHGPEREAARAVAVTSSGVIVAARGLWRIDGEQDAAPLAFDGEPSDVLPAEGGAWIATDAGEIWRYAADGTTSRAARPGTADASLGGLDLASVGDLVLARTRGGALFRGNGESWVGPVVAKNVRRIRGALGAGAVGLVVGSATAPELCATRDGRTFERVPAPEGEVAVDVARVDELVVVACASGRLCLSRDAGLTYRAVPGVVDAERVWAHASGVVLVATFHEATDQGRLLRVASEGAEVLLDVEAEVATRRLSGPGEQDGDGRVHSVALDGRTLFVATGVGVFSIRDALGSS